MGGGVIAKDEHRRRHCRWARGDAAAGGWVAGGEGRAVGRCGAMTPRVVRKDRQRRTSRPRRAPRVASRTQDRGSVAGGERSQDRLCRGPPHRVVDAEALARRVRQLGERGARLARPRTRRATHLDAIRRVTRRDASVLIHGLGAAIGSSARALVGEHGGRTIAFGLAPRGRATTGSRRWRDRGSLQARAIGRQAGLTERNASRALFLEDLLAFRRSREHAPRGTRSALRAWP